MNNLTGLFTQSPLIVLCIVLIYIIRMVYADWKEERKEREVQDRKNSEVMAGLLLNVKENSLEKRNLYEKIKEYEGKLESFEKVLRRIDKQMQRNNV